MTKRLIYRMGARGRVTIPIEIRTAAGLKPGSALSWRLLPTGALSLLSISTGTSHGLRRGVST